MYYLYESFKSPLPYSSCSNPWNSPKCQTVHQIKASFSQNTTLSVDEFWKLVTSSRILAHGLFPLRKEGLSHYYFAVILKPYCVRAPTKKIIM